MSQKERKTNPNGFSKTEIISDEMSVDLLGFCADDLCSCSRAIPIYAVHGDTLTPTAILGEITDDVEIRQYLEIPVDQLNGFSVMTSTCGQAVSDSVLFTLEDEDGTVVAQSVVDASTLKEASYTTVTLDEPVMDHRGESLTLAVTTQGCAPGNAVT